MRLNKGPEPGPEPGLEYELLVILSQQGPVRPQARCRRATRDSGGALCCQDPGQVSSKSKSGETVYFAQSFAWSKMMISNAGSKEFKGDWSCSLNCVPTGTILHGAASRHELISCKLPGSNTICNCVWRRHSLKHSSDKLAVITACAQIEEVAEAG